MMHYFCLALMLSFALPTSARAESDADVAEYEGDGYVTAAMELRESAEKGDPVAQTNLGSMYADGIGVPQSYAEAIRWFRKAAAQGHARAKEMLEALGIGLFPQSTAIEGLLGDDRQAASTQELTAREGDDEHIEVRITVSSVLLPVSHSDLIHHGIHKRVFRHPRHFKPRPLRRHFKHKHRPPAPPLAMHGGRTSESLHQVRRLK